MILSRPFGFSQGLPYLEALLAPLAFNHLPADELSVKLSLLRLQDSDSSDSQAEALNPDGTLLVMPIDGVFCMHFVSFNPDNGSVKHVLLSFPFIAVETETQQGKVTCQGHMVNKYQSLDVISELSNSRICMFNHCAPGPQQPCTYF